MSKALKENFSGPAHVITAAHTAAEQTYGKQSGVWSRWVCDALREKLERDGHTLPVEKHMVANAVIEAEQEGVDVVEVLAREVRKRKRKHAA